MENQLSNPNGTLVTAKSDILGNTLVTMSSIGGKLSQAVLAGNVYTASTTTATTWSVALTTTYTGLVVSNPVTSGKNLIILKASFALSVAPVAIASIGLFTGYSTAGIATHGTPVSPTNCLVGGALGVATADVAATLVGTPVWAMQMMGGFTAGALPSTTPSVIDVDGAIVVKPGGYCGIGALTAVVGLASIIYQEVNV